MRPPPAIAFASDDHEDYQHKQFGGCDCDVMIFAAAQGFFSSVCAEGCAGGEHLITRSVSRFWLFALRDGLKFVPMLLLCLTCSFFVLFCFLY